MSLKPGHPLALNHFEFAAGYPTNTETSIDSELRHRAGFETLNCLIGNVYSPLHGINGNFRRLKMQVREGVVRVLDPTDISREAFP